MTLSVAAPGLLTTVQDLGRHGFEHLGVGPSGPMDPLSHRLANLLVGNPAQAATLELTLAGPSLVFGKDTLIALCGADLSAQMEGQALPLWRPVWVRAGSRLSFGPPVTGARAYLALAGGFQVPEVLGSRSTNLAGGFGGHQGRALRAGDTLAIPEQDEDRFPGPLQALRRGRAPFAALAWFVPWFRELRFERPACLRFVPGPQWPELMPAAQQSLLRETFRLAPASDRQGLRLQGPNLPLRRELVSAPVATGTLQLPPDGVPILLMADRQTTGGYPRLGEVLAVDLPVAAQLRSHETLSFQAVDAHEARRLLLAREQWLADLDNIVHTHGSAWNGA